MSYYFKQQTKSAMDRPSTYAAMQHRNFTLLNIFQENNHRWKTSKDVDYWLQQHSFVRRQLCMLRRTTDLLNAAFEPCTFVWSGYLSMASSAAPLSIRCVAVAEGSNVHPVVLDHFNKLPCLAAMENCVVDFNQEFLERMKGTPVDFRLRLIAVDSKKELGMSNNFEKLRLFANIVVTLYLLVRVQLKGFH